MDNQVARDVIRAAAVDKLERAFFLGPHARRVSFASQQHRILNLVWALRQLNTLPATKANVAIVGGGLTGVMASVALANLGHVVTLFEAKRDVLQRQAFTRHRYIHPTINLWPDARFTYLPTTELPYFDWHASICDELIKALLVEWNFWCGKGNINFVPDRRVKGFQEQKRRPKIKLKPELAFSTPKEFHNEYDIAIVTSGFADEVMPHASHHMTPYWANDNLEQLRTDSGTMFIVSGCGDGGLIDSLRLAHSKFRDGVLIVDVLHALTSEAWPHAELIANAERNVAKPANYKGALEVGSKELEDVYETAAENLPDSVTALLAPSLLSTLGLVKLVCRQQFPYAPAAAPIHKLLFAHARNAGIIEHVQGDLKTLTDDQGLVTLPKGADDKIATTLEVQGKIVVRHGAQPNFAELLKDIPGAAISWRNANAFSRSKARRSATRRVRTRTAIGFYKKPRERSVRVGGPVRTVWQPTRSGVGIRHRFNQGK